MDIKGIKDFQYSIIIIINLEADIFSLMEDSENSKQEVVPTVAITLLNFTTVQVLFQQLNGV